MARIRGTWVAVRVAPRCSAVIAGRLLTPSGVRIASRAREKNDDFKATHERPCVRPIRKKRVFLSPLSEKMRFLGFICRIEISGETLLRRI